MHRTGDGVGVGVLVGDGTPAGTGDGILVGDGIAAGIGAGAQAGDGMLAGTGAGVQVGDGTPAGDGDIPASARLFIGIHRATRAMAAEPLRFSTDQQ